jgi:uncharacterized protein YukE
LADRIGGDLGQLSELDRSFQRQSQSVRELTSQLTSAVGTTWWEGPAAERFKSSWERDFKPMLTRLEQELDAAATEVRNRRSQLDQAGR